MSYIRTVFKALSPSQGETNVERDRVIRIYFQNAMSSITLNKNTIFLSYNDEPLDSQYEYDALDRVLSITPNEAMLPNEEYTLTFKSGNSGIKTVTNKILFEDIKYGFFTGELFLTEIPPEEPKEDIEEEEGETPPPEEPPIPEEPEEVFDYFRVLTTYPDNNQLWKTSEVIAVKFNKAITDASKDLVTLFVKPISHLIESNETIPTTNSLSSDKTTIYIKPNVEIAKGEEFQLVVSKDIQSTAGESLGSNYVIHILSEHEFYYLDVDTLKLVAGDFANGYTDIELANLIGNASHNLYNTLSALEIYEFEEFTVVTTGPYGASQYVMYSVIYQMVLGNSLLTASGSSKDIKLGDLSVGGSERVSDTLPELLKMLKAELDRWWKVLLHKNPTAGDDPEVYMNWYRYGSNATRGSTDYPNPDFNTRVPFTGLGE